MKNINANYTRPFSSKDKFGYAFGDLANCLTFTLCSLFFLKFYQEVVGINPAIIGAVMMGCKFFDAFTDAFMGEICDRSKPTKKGRFAPWMMRFAGPVCVAAFLMFAPWVTKWAMPARIFWMIFTYILYGSICYTGVNIPYGSMASAISGSPKDRTELSNFRAIGSTIGGTVIGVVLPILAFDKINETTTKLNGTKVMWITLCLGVLAFCLYLFCYLMTKERIKVKNKVEKFSIVKVFKTWVTSKSVLVVIIATIVCLTATTYFDSMKTYVFVNVYNSPTAQSISNFINCAVTVLLSFAMLPLTLKFGRKALCVIGAFFISAFFFLICILQLKNVGVWTFLTLYSIAFIGNAIFNLVCWAMVGDVIDDAEIKNNKREDGSIYGAYSFSRKMGQALASGISGALLSLIGIKGSDVVYTPELKNSIFNISTLVPAILFAITGLLFLFLYPLTKKKVLANAAYLKGDKTALAEIDTFNIADYKLDNVLTNKSFDQYLELTKDNKANLIVVSKNDVQKFDKKFITYKYKGKTFINNDKGLLLKDRNWWYIDGNFYEVPKNK